MRNFLNLLHAFGIEIDWLRWRLRIPLATLEQLLAGKFPKGRFVLAAQARGSGADRRGPCADRESRH